LLEPCNALRSFRNPFRGRPGQGEPDARNSTEEKQDDEQRSDGLWNVHLDQRRHCRLKQEVQQESENDRQNHLAAEIKDDQHEERQNRGHQEGLQIPRQRHLAPLLRLLRGRIAATSR